MGKPTEPEYDIDIYHKGRNWVVWADLYMPGEYMTETDGAGQDWLEPTSDPIFCSFRVFDQETDHEVAEPDEALLNLAKQVLRELYWDRELS